MASDATRTRTSVLYGVGWPGFGACCVSVKIWASRQAGSTSLPSSVMELEMRVAIADGTGAARAVAASATTNRRRIECRKSSRNLGQHAQNDVMGEFAFKSCTISE